MRGYRFYNHPFASQISTSVMIAATTHHTLPRGRCGSRGPRAPCIYNPTTARARALTAPPSPVAAHQPPTNTSALQQLTQATQRIGLRWYQSRNRVTITSSGNV